MPRYSEVIGLLCLALVTAWLVFGPDNSAELNTPTKSNLSPPEPNGAEIAPARAVLTRPTPTTAAETNVLLTMPDGLRLPPLNGVEQSADPVWPRDRPYSPVTGTRLVDGVEYYTHGDGTLTTTQYLWRTDLDRYDATTVVKHPIAAQTSDH